MERSWRDFQAIYGGIEGARAAFEKVCEELFVNMYPEKNPMVVRANPGDEGIDIFMGEIGIDAIIVVQCKFFLEQLAKSQKDQLNKSFTRAITSEKYKMSEWILCIPKD